MNRWIAVLLVLIGLGVFPGCDVLPAPPPQIDMNLAQGDAIALVAFAALGAPPRAPDPAPAPEPLGVAPPPGASSPAPIEESVASVAPGLVDPGVEDAPPAPPEFVGEIREKHRSRSKTVTQYLPTPGTDPTPPQGAPHADPQWVDDGEVVTVGSCESGSCGATRMRRGLFGRWRRR